MAAEEPKHPLNSGWTLWYDSNMSHKNVKTWGNHLKAVYTFNFVEDFWSLYYNIKPPHELSPGSDYHFFREGIEPAWEHEANAGGGKWLISLSPKQRSQLEQRWLFTLLACIGESLEDPDSPVSLVCGAVLSLRKANDRIAIWTRHADEERIMALGTKFQAALAEHLKGENVNFGYFPHDDAAVTSKSKNAIAKYTLPPLP